MRQLRDQARTARPVAHVHAGAPPFLLVHGDHGGLVPSEHSRTLHRLLRAEGIETTLLLVAGADHEDPAFETPPVLAAVRGFLRSVLAG